MLDDLPPNGSAVMRWDGAILAQVAEINEQLLDLLRAAAAGPAPGRRLVRELSRQWCDLTPAASRRLAGCPYLLIDAGFGEAGRWPLVAGGVQDAPAGPGYFGSAEGVALLRRALLFAWHLARANPLSARIALGMPAACLQAVAAARLRDLETLAEHCPAWIRPRWERQPHIWAQLIRAAAQGDPLRLRQLQWRGMALLAAGLGGAGVPAAGSVRVSRTTALV